MILLLTAAAFLASILGAAFALALGSAWPLLWGYVIAVFSPVPVIALRLAWSRVGTGAMPVFKVLTSSR